MCYLKSEDLPFYKQRISELVDIFTKPNTLAEMRSFHFGFGNKSFLLFYSGFLIGEINNPKTGFRDQFQVTGLSGEDLAVYLEYAAAYNYSEIIFI